MAKHPDVAVVGGGIIGLTCAYFLAREGLRVEVFDRGDLGKEASWAGAGILPPGNPAGAATPIDKLRAIGSVRFPDFSAELRELTGIGNGYLRCGGVEFLEPAEAREVTDLWRAEGIAFERVPDAQLPEYWHELGVAVRLPDCAQVRNPRHLRALVAACERAGVRLRAGADVSGWVATAGGRRAEAVELSAQERVHAGRFLIAAGAWSGGVFDALTRPAEYTPLVHPVRGQIVLLNTGIPEGGPVLMWGKRYIVPRADGRVLVGSTEEPEAGFEKANTAEAVAGLIAFATRLNPDLASAEVEKCWSGLRPATPDGLPFIGPVPGWENVFVATGHFRAGVQLSVGTAQAVAELLAGRPTCVPLEAFALDRKPHAGGTAAFRS